MMMESTTKEVQEIEKLVRARETESAKLCIIKYLKSDKHSIERRIEACDWYRRLGLNRDAFLIIRPKIWTSLKCSTLTEEGKVRLWCARLINLLGGTKTALAIITNHLILNTAEDHRIVGNIYLSAYMLNEAIFHLEHAKNLEVYPLSYKARMAIIGLCDAYAGNNQGQKALSLIDTIEVLPEEKLLKGIILQAKAEYFISLSLYDEAILTLAEAKIFFPEKLDPDNAILLKWQGYADAMNGAKDSSLTNFKRALLILESPDIRPEAWIDIYFQMHKCHLIDEQLLIKALLYPGLSAGFLSRIPSLTRDEIILGDSEDFIIYASRGEWYQGGNWYVGFTKEIELLSYLIRSGDHGISFVRVASLLWSTDVAGLPNLEQRVYKLLKRIKDQYKINWSVKSNTIIIDKSQNFKLVFSFYYRKPTFFEKHPQFSMQEFSSYYNLSSSGAKKVIKKMSEAEVVCVSSEKRTDYRFYSWVDDSKVAFFLN